MSALVTRQRRRVLTIAVAATTIALAPLTTANAAESTFGYQGSAFGSSVTVLGAVESGPTAQISYGCGTPAGLSRTATSVGISVPPSVASTGAITTTGATTASPATSRTSAQTASVNVLGGLVTANSLTAVSESKFANGSYSVSANGTSFAGLRVLGLPLLVSPAPNTRIDLPGVGYVVLNEQSRQVTASSAALRVTALRAKVTQNNLQGFEVGTEVVISQAYSALKPPAGGFLGGFAYGTAAQIGPLLSSAPSFRVNLPCEGTNGQVRERNGAGVDIPGILDSGTIRDTVVGSTTATSATGTATSTVQTVDLLAGLITATGVTSVATATRTNGSTSVSDNGTTFTTITVAGDPLVVAQIAPNTTLSLPGVGTVTLRRTIQTSTSLEVRAIEVKVLQTNTFGLPLGSTITVAVAKAQAR